jgi:hypothetical protein
VSAVPTGLVEELVGQLGDSSRAEDAACFPLVRGSADHPGLYAWWSDVEGLGVLSTPFGEELPTLIYAGQAGATSTRTAVQMSATLRSRICQNHLNGNVASSIM